MLYYCTAGLSGMSDEGSYKFLHEKLMRAKWIADVRQKNLGITPHTDVCSSQYLYSLALAYIRLLCAANWFRLKYVLPPIEFNSTTQLKC